MYAIEGTFSGTALIPKTYPLNHVIFFKCTFAIAPRPADRFHLDHYSLSIDYRVIAASTDQSNSYDDNNCSPHTIPQIAHNIGRVGEVTGRAVRPKACGREHSVICRSITLPNYDSTDLCLLWAIQLQYHSSKADCFGRKSHHRFRCFFQDERR